MLHPERKFIVIKKIKLGIAAGSVCVLVILINCLLFGKLFPYSPVIVGFSRHELASTVVYIQRGADTPDLSRIDGLIPDVENFHKWKFLSKPRIFIFKDKKSYYQRSMSRARFCAYYNGDIVISPWALQEAEKGEISLEIYLTHELSHSLIHQHSGMIRALHYPAWLLEGIAMYSADQMGTSWYPSKEQTCDYIRQGNFMPPEYFKTGKEDRIHLDVEYRTTFIYSEFACIVDYLVEKYGMDRFLSYVKELTASSNHDQVFKKTFDIEFSDCIQDFRESAIQGQHAGKQSSHPDDAQQSRSGLFIQ